jgi:hypothetical protein
MNYTTVPNEYDTTAISSAQIDTIKWGGGAGGPASINLNGTVTSAGTTLNGSSHVYTTNGTYGGSYIYPAGNTAPVWATIDDNNIKSSLKVQGDADFNGKVKIKGQDLAEFMETMSKRLAILVPDPKKLEHFKALQKAYDHYKTLEALCQLPESTDDK